MGQISSAIIHLLHFCRSFYLLLLFFFNVSAVNNFIKHIIMIQESDSELQRSILDNSPGNTSVIWCTGLQGAVVCLSAIKHLENSPTMQQNIIG